MCTVDENTSVIGERMLLLSDGASEHRARNNIRVANAVDKSGAGKYIRTLDNDSGSECPRL